MIGLGLRLNRYRKAGSAFAPDSIDNTMLQWYTFEAENVEDESSGSISNGETIGNVVDRSGNSRSLTKNANATNSLLWNSSAINGIPGAEGDKTSRSLRYSNGSDLATVPYTTFVVFRLDSIAGSNYITEGSQANKRVIFFENANNLGMYQGGAAFNYTTGFTMDTSPHYAVCEWNGSSSKLWIDGVELTMDGGDSGTQGYDGIILGSHIIGVNPIDGVITEFAAWDGQLSSGDLASLNEYAAEKFNIT